MPPSSPPPSLPPSLPPRDRVPDPTRILRRIGLGMVVVVAGIVLIGVVGVARLDPRPRMSSDLQVIAMDPLRRPTQRASRPGSFGQHAQPALVSASQGLLLPAATRALLDATCAETAAPPAGLELFATSSTDAVGEWAGARRLSEQILADLAGLTATGALVEGARNCIDLYALARDARWSGTLKGAAFAARLEGAAMQPCADFLLALPSPLIEEGYVGLVAVAGGSAPRSHVFAREAVRARYERFGVLLTPTQRELLGPGPAAVLDRTTAVECVPCRPLQWQSYLAWSRLDRQLDELVPLFDEARERRDEGIDRIEARRSWLPGLPGTSLPPWSGMDDRMREGETHRSLLLAALALERALRNGDVVDSVGDLAEYGVDIELFRDARTGALPRWERGSPGWALVAGGGVGPGGVMPAGVRPAGVRPAGVSLDEGGAPEIRLERRVLPAELEGPEAGATPERDE